MIKESDDEIWKEIEGLECRYAVSTKGNIKNLKTGRLLIGSYDGTGYKIVRLNGKNYKIHRLVALAFLDNPDKLPEVNHIDENKNNNDISNIEWCSSSYNVNYSNHKRSCKIKQLTKDGKLIKVWNSLSQIERELGYFRQSIIKVCKGKQRSSHNFKWEYLDSSSQRIYNRPIVVHKGDEYIGTFASTAKASEALGLKYDSIYGCLMGRFNSTHGYRFKYVE